MLQRGHTLSATASAYLEGMVLNDLVPGDKLPPERVLAENLEVSRTTIREALRDLEQRRLVTRTPGRGTVVLPRSAKATQLLETMGDDAEESHVAELRMLVEPQVAGLAADRATSSDLLQLEEILASTHAGLNPAESLAQDVAFHMQIARAARNPLLVSLCQLSSGWVQTVRARSHATRDGRRTSFIGHQEILRAVRNHDHDAATAAMTAHLDDVARLVERRHR
ncbi:FadR/GntR family transcriptional regulator [Gordonia insulae]|uniref:HTH-type transcriptional regulator LutR n=1 Tax=Gordonia insulae TaxID=2420509 RepID=A0A3G8JHR4_9ACTN|nr:FCD domain-containing protein [Gordonia insulae]AZG44554.1 HTH-type transcriptional regulator LutR [Gordonia insulae]